MDRHAGFAAAVSIRESLLADLMRVMYHSGDIPHQFSGSFASAAADMFLDKPLVTCAPGNNDQMILDLRAWGLLAITPAGRPASTRLVLMRLRVFAPPLLTLDGASLRFRLDGPGSTLQSLDVDPLVGGPYPLDAQTVLDSEAFFTGIQTLVQTLLGSLQQVVPPLDLSFLGPVATDPSAAVTHVVLDRAIAIGIDVTNASSVTTHGTRGLLTDTTAGNDIGMWTNPTSLPLTLADVRAKIEEKVVQQEATLDSLNFSLQEGSFHIAGGASKGNLGSVSFSLDTAPRLFRPSYCEEWDEEYGEHFKICTDDRNELWFEVQHVDVDVDRPWWVVVLDVLGALFTFGIGTIVIESIVGMIRNNIANGVGRSGGSTVANRVQEFTFPGIPETAFQLTIVQYECHLEGVYVGLNLRPQIPAPGPAGPGHIGIEEAATATLRWRIRLPFDLQEQDPLLSVRWTVRRTDTNEVLITRDMPAAGNLTLDLSGLPALLETPSLDIKCRVYQTMGPVTTDMFNGSATLTIFDRLDRSHPFVQWQHFCYVPVVRIEADGSRTQVGLDPKQRRSRIHRTDVPGRCRMASRFSLGEPSPLDGSIPTSPTYLDDLPFPVEQLAANRRLVCDYCFFGGPTRFESLLP